MSGLLGSALATRSLFGGSPCQLLARSGLSRKREVRKVPEETRAATQCMRAKQNPLDSPLRRPLRKWASRLVGVGRSLYAMRKRGHLRAGVQIKRVERPVGTPVKDQRIAGDLTARDHFTQNDIVVARLVDRGDPAAELSGSAL